MAGQREQSADTSLDDILSSIRKIVSDDLNGAEQLREKLADAQAAAADMSSRAVPESSEQAISPSSVFQQAARPELTSTDPDNTAALVAAARAAAGTSAREFVASEPQPSQADVATPRESLAPFDRATPAPDQGEPISNLGTDLGAPIVLPTETGPADETIGHDPAFGVADQAFVADAPAEQNYQAPLEVSTEEPLELNADVSQMNGHADGGDYVGEEPHVNGQACMNGQANGEVNVNGSALSGTVEPDPIADEAEEPVTLEVVPEGASAEATLVTDATPASTTSVAPAAAPQVAGMSSKVLEQAVTRMLRPMLKDWLDENMPRLIEQALRDDVADPSTDGRV